MDIAKEIKKYDRTKEILGEGADSMEFGEDRGKFIEKYKNSLENKVKSLAVWLHENYEEIAKGENWNTQESCKVEFNSLPEENKKVMLELSKRILESS